MHALSKLEEGQMTRTFEEIPSHVHRTERAGLWKRLFLRPELLENEDLVPCGSVHQRENRKTKKQSGRIETEWESLMRRHLCFAKKIHPINRN
jgi:hypothetical protein